MRYILGFIVAALTVAPALAQLPQTTLTASRPPQSTLPEADPFSLASQLCDCDPCTCLPGKCACANCPCPNGMACKPVAHSAVGATWETSPYAGQWALRRAGKQIGGYDGKVFRWLDGDTWSDPVTCPVALPSAPVRLTPQPQAYYAPQSFAESGTVCRS